MSVASSNPFDLRLIYQEENTVKILFDIKDLSLCKLAASIAAIVSYNRNKENKSFMIIENKTGKSKQIELYETAKIAAVLSRAITAYDCEDLDRYEDLIVNGYGCWVRNLEKKSCYDLYRFSNKTKILEFASTYMSLSLEPVHKIFRNKLGRKTIFVLDFEKNT